MAVGSSTLFLPRLERSEQELLLCCIRTDITAKTLKRVKSLLQSNIDWNYLIQTAINHGVVQLLYQSLSNHFQEFVPQEKLAELKEIFCANTAYNIALTNELLKVLELLATQNILAIPFKGSVLAISAYGNLSLRQISDLDFLVAEDDFLKAVNLLVTQGYQLTVQVPWESHLISRDDYYSIDLHREIVPKHLSSSLQSNYIWEHLKSLSILGKTVTTLNPEACLLILCLNGTKECWQNLSRICDIAELIRAHPDLDWQEVMKQSEKMGFKRVIFLGLFLARNLVGANFPDFIWQQIQSDKVLKSLSLKIYKQLFSLTWKSYGTVETTLFHIKSRERWRDKAQSFLGLMLLSGWLHPTQRDRDIIPLPFLFSFLYYLIRPIRVFLKYKKLLLGI